MILIRALRFVFHLLYHQLAWTYDWVASVVSAGLWVRWVRSMVVHLEGCTEILEIGHGPGHLMQTLIESNYHVTGIDLSPQMSQQAKRLLLKSDTSPGLVRADARLLPFRDGSFDAVIATFPAEYIAEPETWISFRRMLAPEGRIVVLLGARPGGNHPLNLLSRLLFRITGQIGNEEIERARTRFVAYFDQVGLTWTYHTGSVRNSETYYVIAEPKLNEDVALRAV